LNDVVAVGVQLLCDCWAVAERLTDDEHAVGVQLLCACCAVAERLTDDEHAVGVQLLCDCCAVAERLTDDEQQRYHKIEPLSLVKATTSTDTRSPVLYMWR